MWTYGSFLKNALPRSIAILAVVTLLTGCGLNAERRGLPSEVAAAVDSITADIAAERYEKIYREADELFRKDATLEESTAALKTLKEKLGPVKNRMLHSAVEQQNSGGELKGRVFILSYQTSFEKGSGMESFTLVERNHQWLLARYRVNSTELR